MIVGHISPNRKRNSFLRRKMEDIFPDSLPLWQEVELLTDDEVQKIISLNTKLYEVAKAIASNEKRLEAELENKKKSGEIYDYELETKVTYYLSALGAVYHETFSPVGGMCRDEEFDDWNDRRHIEHPIFTMKHCWLFHDLYDHLHLSLRAISFIDNAIWETTVIEEHAVRFDK